MHPAEEMESIRWLDKYVRRAVRDELNKMGIPRLFVPAIVHQVYKNGSKTFADIYLNGSSTLTTNVPVNPSESTNVVANTPVWVIAINFNNLDLFILCRKLA